MKRLLFALCAPVRRYIITINRRVRRPMKVNLPFGRRLICSYSVSVIVTTKYNVPAGPIRNSLFARSTVLYFLYAAIKIINKLTIDTTCA